MTIVLYFVRDLPAYSISNGRLLVSGVLYRKIKLAFSIHKQSISEIDDWHDRQPNNTCVAMYIHNGLLLDESG